MTNAERAPYAFFDPGSALRSISEAVAEAPDLVVRDVHDEDRVLATADEVGQLLAERLAAARQHGFAPSVVWRGVGIGFTCSTPEQPISAATRALLQDVPGLEMVLTANHREWHVPLGRHIAVDPAALVQIVESQFDAAATSTLEPGGRTDA